MKVDLSKNEWRIVLKALSNRTEDLTRFADKSEMQGHKTTMREFLEMANDNDDVFQKIQDAFDKAYGDA